MSHTQINIDKNYFYFFWKLSLIDQMNSKDALQTWKAKCPIVLKMQKHTSKRLDYRLYICISTLSNVSALCFKLTCRGRFFENSSSELLHTQSCTSFGPHNSPPSVIDPPRSELQLLRTLEDRQTDRQTKRQTGWQTQLPFFTVYVR